ncbi:hypothetical protein VP01_1117g7 [Puccinia sorghi]|uniref:Uncharacterized protein n=1 Tax=Puccinia sorghi TaxID=27349 RepID=A0A0L6VSR3_9BASI|nr:hypothetical protein VP01_1117g7 [Puccinia sorghi]
MFACHFYGVVDKTSQQLISVATPANFLLTIPAKSCKNSNVPLESAPTAMDLHQAAHQGTYVSQPLSSFSNRSSPSVCLFLKVLMPSLVGAALVKYRKLDQDGLKAAAHIQIYGALPCLMFASIVPTINAQNLHRILVCVGFALFYMLVSYVLSKALLMVASVPSNFRNGFIVAAVVSKKSFQIFPQEILLSHKHIYVWSNWGIKLWEYPHECHTIFGRRTTLWKAGRRRDGRLVCFILRHGLQHHDVRWTRNNTELNILEMIDRDYMPSEQARITTPYLPCGPTLSHSEEAGNMNQREADRPTRDSSPEIEMRVEQEVPHAQLVVSRGVLTRLLHHLSPVIISLAVGTLVAVTPPLKGLFTVLKGHVVQKPTTPDGKPLLSVILDSTEYLGAAAIPLGLLVTGASFANMSISRRVWHRLPFRAIVGLTIVKLICLPASGVLAVSFIDKYSALFLGEEGRVLKMICLYYSCTVTSTNQISLASIAAGVFLKPGENSNEEVASNVDLLCSFVALQVLFSLSSCGNFLHWFHDQNGFLIFFFFSLFHIIG